MKKLVFFVLSVIVCIAIEFSTSKEAQSYAYGAPAGYTGSPHDGKTCYTGCHSGSAVTSVSGWITSNIPPTGYLPDSTYTITATASHPGINTYGFEISPQDSASGTILGTLIATNTAQTALAGTGYITQTSGGTSGTGSKTWSFEWTAPHKGSGNVTFYGAFNCANGNGKKSGDLIYTSQLKVNEGPTGILPVELKALKCSTYPNPCLNDLTIDFTAGKSNNYCIQLLTLDGKEIQKRAITATEYEAVSLKFNLENEKPGMLILRILGSKEIFTGKILHER